MIYSSKDIPRIGTDVFDPDYDNVEMEGNEEVPLKEKVDPVLFSPEEIEMD